MTVLLTIPRETRDAIIELVLFSGRPAPVDYNYVSIPARTTSEDIDYQSSLGSHGVMYESETMMPAATPLLLANRQLHAETKGVLERMPGGGHKYSLDLMFVQERELWPTWTSLPAFAQHIDTLDVTIRVMGGHDKVGAGYSRLQTIWQGGDCSPPAVDWLFYGALERLLKAGPMGKISEPEPEPGEKGRSRKKWGCEKEAGLVDREVTVKRLNLNVVTPADTTKLADMDCKLEWLGARQAGWGRPLEVAEKERLQKTAMRPEWLADFMIVSLRSLLEMGSQTFIYASIVYERMEDITISVDGELRKEYKLSEMLSVLPCNEYSHTEEARERRMRQLYNWREWVSPIREKAGLPVKPLEVSLSVD